MTSFLSSNITPTNNNFHDWLDIKNDNVLIGSGEITMYSTDDKTSSSTNVLKATDGGKILKWVDNAGYITILADTIHPATDDFYFSGGMNKGVTQVINFVPPDGVILDPALNSLNQNGFTVNPNNSITYSGSNNNAFLINITGYLSITGGAGAFQTIDLTFANGLGVYTNTEVMCIDNGTNLVQFCLSGLTICNNGDVMGLIATCANAVQANIMSLHFTMQPISKITVT